MKKILVMGAYGLLGNSLCPLLDMSGFNIFRQGRNASAQIQCNPVNTHEVLNAIEKCDPDIVINLIANTNVDMCEETPELAYIANMKVTESIVLAIQFSSKKDIHLIHIFINTFH